MGCFRAIEAFFTYIRIYARGYCVLGIMLGV